MTMSPGEAAVEQAQWLGRWWERIDFFCPAGHEWTATTDGWGELDPADECCPECEAQGERA